MPKAKKTNEKDIYRKPQDSKDSIVEWLRGSVFWSYFPIILIFLLDLISGFKWQAYKFFINGDCLVASLCITAPSIVEMKKQRGNDWVSLLSLIVMIIECVLYIYFLICFKVAEAGYDKVIPFLSIDDSVKSWCSGICVFATILLGIAAIVTKGDNQ